MDIKILLTIVITLIVLIFGGYSLSDKNRQKIMQTNEKLFPNAPNITAAQLANSKGHAVAMIITGIVLLLVTLMIILYKP